MSTEQREIITSLGLLTGLLHCWPLFTFLSPETHSSFSAALLRSQSGPHRHCCGLPSEVPDFAFVPGDFHQASLSPFLQGEWCSLNCSPPGSTGTDPPQPGVICQHNKSVPSYLLHIIDKDVGQKSVQRGPVRCSTCSPAAKWGMIR